MKGSRGLLVAKGSVVLAAAWLGGCGHGSGTEDPPPEPEVVLEVSSSAYELLEGGLEHVDLRASSDPAGGSVAWSQVRGPRVRLVPEESGARVDLSSLSIAADVELVFRADATFPSGARATRDVTVVVRAADLRSSLGPRVQLGGATSDVELVEEPGGDWLLHNVGNRLVAARLAEPEVALSSLALAGFVHDVELVSYLEHRYALVALGAEGLAVVAADRPDELEERFTVQVAYRREGITFTDRGGNVQVDQVVEGRRGPLVAVEADAASVWLANQAFGVHRTSLANLLGPGAPVLEPDGTLTVEAEAFTLQFAGEEPWGRPRAMQLHAGRLVCALGPLGIAAYDGQSLERLGGYNLYTDPDAREDWAGSMVLAEEVADPGWLDPVTGMPNHLQVQYEIVEVGHGGAEAPTPWADFDVEGKYYYDARDVHVVPSGHRTLVYVACGLGGVLAVDAERLRPRRPNAPEPPGLLGYLPAVPAHGPTSDHGGGHGGEDEGGGGHGGGGQGGGGHGGGSDSLFAQQGAGRLREAGAVAVVRSGDRLLFTDHFGGLVAVAGAGAPERTWRGPCAPYDNDTNGVPGDRLPPYEAVTSFDMRALDPADEESPPAWMGAAPAELATGEIGGHGGRLRLASGIEPQAAGKVDVLVAVGAGGVALVDLVGLGEVPPGEAYELVAGVSTTDEPCAGPGGLEPRPLSIGHTDGVAASGTHLFVADGPHGVSAWSLLNEEGFARAVPRLAGNTLQGTEELALPGGTLLPAPHAHGVVLDPDGRSLLAACRSAGVRRLGLAPLSAGPDPAEAPPVLLAPATGDVFEHKAGEASVGGLSKQDHASDVAVLGHLVLVADGPNGLTIYDRSRDPSDPESGFLAANVGGGGGGSPGIGNTSGVAVWRDPDDGRVLALVAAGPAGLAVVDVSRPRAPELVRVFRPGKGGEHGGSGSVDGRSVDVVVAGDHAFLSYDTSGVLAFACRDLVAPAAAEAGGGGPGSGHGGSSDGPAPVGRFRLEDHVEDPAAVAGAGAQRMTCVEVGGRRTLLVAYGTAGLARIDWSDPGRPLLLELCDTVGESSDVAAAGGRVFVADGPGGVAVLE